MTKSTSHHIAKQRNDADRSINIVGDAHSGKLSEGQYQTVLNTVQVGEDISQGRIQASECKSYASDAFSAATKKNCLLLIRATSADLAAARCDQLVQTSHQSITEALHVFKCLTPVDQELFDVTQDDLRFQPHLEKVVEETLGGSKCYHLLDAHPYDAKQRRNREVILRDLKNMISLLNDPRLQKIYRNPALIKTSAGQVFVEIMRQGKKQVQDSIDLPDNPEPAVTIMELQNKCL